MKVAVKNLENKKVGDKDLQDSVFGVEEKSGLLHQMVNYQLAKRRSGNHKVKDISEISGTGKKPFKQKGTGNARLGSLRGAQQRGGQTTHGPQVRDHGFNMPKKQRQLALKMALSSKLANDKLVVLEDVKVKSHKTKDLVKALDAMKLSNVLFIGTAEMDENFLRASNNIPMVDVLAQEGANVYDIMRHDTVVLTVDAIEKLEARLA